MRPATCIILGVVALRVAVLLLAGEPQRLLVQPVLEPRQDQRDILVRDGQQVGGADRVHAQPGTPLEPAPECADPAIFPGSVIPPLGGTETVTPTTKGTHHYICLIHPWMLTDVTVK